MGQGREPAINANATAYGYIDFGSDLYPDSHGHQYGHHRAFHAHANGNTSHTHTDLDAGTADCDCYKCATYRHRHEHSGSAYLNPKPGV